jgi:hypothetical protein
MGKFTTASVEFEDAFGQWRARQQPGEYGAHLLRPCGCGIHDVYHLVRFGILNYEIRVGKQKTKNKKKKKKKKPKIKYPKKSNKQTSMM